MSTATEKDTRTRPRVDQGNGDHDRFAHVVFPKSQIVESMVNGTPVTALCGKRWVPSRDPKNFPVCPACKDILEQAGIDLPSS